MSTVRIYRGDTPLFQFAIKQKDGSALDLTGATVYFAASRADAAAVAFDEECTVSTIMTDGLAEVRLTADDTAVVGTYTAEIEVRYAGTPELIFTATQFTLVIVDDIRKG
jgi:hypothetical protein